MARAQFLADQHPDAAEMLRFYAELTTFQDDLARTARPITDEGELLFVERLDLDGSMRARSGFHDFLRRSAPPHLARGAARVLSLSDSAFRSLLHALLTEEVEEASPVEGFVAEALLQPFAEAAAVHIRSRIARDTGSPRKSARCPVCGSRPVAGALREEGHGARRTLTCGLCLTEWDYHRVICVACSEERFDALPIFTADTLPHVRIEACDTCHQYLKTIDLSRNALAVPMVDDLATPALDLWARERGYRRVRENVLRT
jgi:FdhE protein